MEVGNDRRAKLITHEHDWMVDRLRSLEASLEGDFEFSGKPDDRGEAQIVLRRCKELQHALVQHMPDEEEMYAKLAEDREMRPLVERLKAEHRVMDELLDETVQVLEKVDAGGQPGPEYFALPAKLRRFCQFMQQHIETENLYVLPRLAA